MMTIKRKLAAFLALVIAFTAIGTSLPSAQTEALAATKYSNLTNIYSGVSIELNQAGANAGDFFNITNAASMTVPASVISKVSYTSSDEAVATVDASTGALTLAAEGTATITATCSGMSASYELTVAPADAFTSVREGIAGYDNIVAAAGNLISAYETGLNTKTLESVLTQARSYRKAAGSYTGVSKSNEVYGYDLVRAWKYYRHVNAYANAYNPFKLTSSEYFTTTWLVGSGKTVVAKLKKKPTKLQLISLSAAKYISGKRSSLATDSYNFTVYLKSGSSVIKATATIGTHSKYVTITPSKSLSRGRTYTLCSSKNGSEGTWLSKGVLSFRAT